MRSANGSGCHGPCFPPSPFPHHAGAAVAELAVVRRLATRIQYPNGTMRIVGLLLLFGGFAWLCWSAFSTPPKTSWARYPAAVVVAFVASVATGVIYTVIGAATGMTSDSSPTLSDVPPAIFNFLAGFAGVFFGSLCLRRCDRLFGSAGLLVLGICFEVLMLGSAHGEFHFPRGAIATGIGGLLVVGIWFGCRPPNTALEPTAAAPSISDVPGNPKVCDSSTSASGGGGSAFGR